MLVVHLCMQLVAFFDQERTNQTGDDERAEDEHQGLEPGAVGKQRWTPIRRRRKPTPPS
jgi:hypothetical protein